MAVGNLVVELTLNDGQYQARMRQAGQAAQTLTGSFDRLDSRLKGIEGGLSGMLPHLRDIAIVTSSLHSIVSGVSDTFGALAHSLISANSEIERSTVLLQGLSKSVDMEGKIAGATKDINFLFETAKQAPFALKELTNSFVKMNAVGLTQTENKLRSLTDAIANFGGSDEGLHRSTVAIQQMASKGVISMEELRQQLGESLPNAMQMMADGMGLPLATLIKNVSEGKVKAVNAIDVMLQEMEFTMQGSSKRMMETWSGMTSQLSTNWMLLQKQVGDAGGFNSAKDALRDLNTFLQSDDALKYGQSLGDGLRVAIDGVVGLTKSFNENKDAIAHAGEGLLAFWAITKSIAPAQAIVMGLTGAFGTTGSVMTTLNATTSMWKNALASSIPITTTTMGGLMNLERTVVTTATSVGALARANAVLSATFATLLGPIGLLVTAVGVIGYEYFQFRDKAVHALDDVIEKQKELNALQTARVDGDAALKTRKDIEEAKKAIDILEGQKNALLQQNKQIHENGPGDMFSPGLWLAKEKNSKEVDELSEKQRIARQSIEEGNEQLFERTTKRSTALVRESISQKEALLTDSYKRQKDQIMANLTAMAGANKTQIEQDKYLNFALIELQKSETGRRIELLEGEKKANLAIRKELMESSNTAIPAFMNLTVDKSGLEKDKVEILAEIGVIQAQIDQATKNGTDTKVLTAALEEKKKALEGTSAALTKVETNLKAIKSSGAILDKDITNISMATDGMVILSGELERYLKLQDDLAKGKPMGEFGMMSMESGKELKNLQSEWESAQKSLAGYADDYYKLHSKSYNKAAVGMGGEVSQQMSDVFGGVTKDPSASEDDKRLAEGARSFTSSAFSNKKDSAGIDKNTENLKDEILAMRALGDEFKSSGKLREDGLKLSDEEIAATDKLAAAREHLKNGSKDIPELKSANTVHLERMIQEAEQVGSSTIRLRENLATSLSIDAKNAELKGVEKTAAEFARIDAKQVQDAIRAEDFKADLRRKSDQAMVESRLLLNGTKEELYAQDTKNFTDNLKDQLLQHEISTDAEVKEVIDAQLKMREERRKTDEAHRINAANKAFDNVVDQGMASRMVGTQYARDKAELEVGYAQAVETTTEKLREQGMSETELANELRLLHAQRGEDYKNLEYAHRTSFDRMAQDTIDFRQVVGDAASQFTNGMIDGMTMLATDGSANFRKFATSVLNDIGKMLIKMALMRTFQIGMGMLSGGAAAVVSESTSALSSGLDSFSSSAANSINTTAMGNGGFWEHANGGIMTSMGDIPLKAYANGGIANRPQLSLFGEGKTPEAYVPLPDGRSIPVTMSGSEGGVTGVTIQINVDNKGNASTSDQKTGSGAGATGDMWGKMADNVKSVVLRTIAEEKRPGGQLWSS